MRFGEYFMYGHRWYSTVDFSIMFQYCALTSNMGSLETGKFIDRVIFYIPELSLSFYDNPGDIEPIERVYLDVV